MLAGAAGEASKTSQSSRLAVLATLPPTSLALLTMSGCYYYLFGSG
jgi:hypothetical protein